MINSQQPSVDPIDSTFIRYYALLDSIINHGYEDKSMRRIDAISFMEKLTNIEAASDGNYYGKFSFTESDLKKWKQWYENKSIAAPLYVISSPQFGVVYKNNKCEVKRRYSSARNYEWR